MKRKIEKTPFAPRNGHVAAMRKMSAGSHAKPVKAGRKADRQRLHKLIREDHPSRDCAASVIFPE